MKFTYRKIHNFGGKLCFGTRRNFDVASSVVSHPCLKRAFRVSFRTRERVQDRILWRFVWALCHVSISPDKVKGKWQDDAKDVRPGILQLKAFTILSRHLRAYQSPLLEPCYFTWTWGCYFRLSEEDIIYKMPIL